MKAKEMSRLREMLADYEKNHGVICLKEDGSVNWSCSCANCSSTCSASCTVGCSSYCDGGGKNGHLCWNSVHR